MEDRLENKGFVYNKFYEDNEFVLYHKLKKVKIKLDSAHRFIDSNGNPCGKEAEKLKSFYDEKGNPLDHPIFIYPDLYVEEIPLNEQIAELDDSAFLGE